MLHLGACMGCPWWPVNALHPGCPVESVCVIHGINAWYSVQEHTPSTKLLSKAVIAGIVEMPMRFYSAHGGTAC